MTYCSLSLSLSLSSRTKKALNMGGGEHGSMVSILASGFSCPGFDALPKKSVLATLALVNWHQGSYVK